MVMRLDDALLAGAAPGLELVRGRRDASVLVIGGGLAGCEAAWQLASTGLPVRLVEMRGGAGGRRTEAHQGDRLAELVCSNSFRSDDATANAVGVLHAEMRLLGSLIMAMADRHRLPAGSALAVDREGFAAGVQAAIEAEPLIELVRAEVTALPAAGSGPAILATGPLTSTALATDLASVTGEGQLAFFDAIAPIVLHESVDLDVAWKQSRWDKVGQAATGLGDGTAAVGDGADYLNCPMDKEQYEAFIAALLAADTVPFRAFEAATPYFQGCLPIEVMASRGADTLRFGPMKPVGLRDPRTGRRPWAVVQLRQDNRLGTLWNMVGFQTKLRHAEQARVLRLIPGLERAEFARLGGLHRNTFINSPRLLDRTLRLKLRPNLRVAGQITGVEGYVESAAMGLLAGRFTAAELLGLPLDPPPPDTAHGGLLTHVTGGADAATFQPMNVTFGLLPPPPEGTAKQGRKPAQAARALASLRQWQESHPLCLPCTCQQVGIG